jgi:hypothetical protein
MNFPDVAVPEKRILAGSVLFCGRMGQWRIAPSVALNELEMIYELLR